MVVVGTACFPLLSEHPTTRTANAASNAQVEKRCGTIVSSMTLAAHGWFQSSVLRVRRNRRRIGRWVWENSRRIRVVRS